MDINLHARLNAQVPNKIVSGGKCLHTITLRGDSNSDDFVIVQIPLETSDKIETTSRFIEVLSAIVSNDLPFYPCVGTGFGLSILDSNLELLVSYSREGIDSHLFVPHTIRDKIL